MFSFVNFHKLHMIKDEIGEVYANLAIGTFAVSIIGIFIPIFLYLKGFSLMQILIYFIVTYGTLALFAPVSGIISSKIGMKHVIMFRTPLMIVYFVLLNYVLYLGIPIYLLGVLYGISSSLYWVPLNTLFTKYSDRMHRGRQVGKLIAYPKILAIAGPFIGGLIMMYFGFGMLVLASSLIFGLSIIPLLFSKDIKPHVKYKFSDVFNKRLLKYMFAFGVQGQEHIATVVLWPLFVYILLVNVVSVGLVGTFTSVGIVAFILITGKFSDNRNLRFTLLKAGAVLTAVLWFSRIFVSSQIQVFFITFLAGLFAVLILVPFHAITFDKAKKEKDSHEFIVFREIALGIGRVAYLFVILFVVNKFVVGFSVTAVLQLFFAMF